ncbi:MAG: exonuclease SbcCD subunit D [Anaerolineales bacterium]|nr:exonuclease SbcCD subunit D [Anaerolineales bacterium]MCB9127474.1 exonuclease SbcCD subunit D [Ardenticatenales bacterium]MCB9172193.1 exonuclease SbcCD subunit D [Ardenticatenales bacterium]
MIRLLHFADLHLGVENYGRLDPETGLSTRLNDFLRAFDFVIDYALDEKIDLVVFAGDAFKNRDPSPTHQREFAKRIQRLSEAGMPTFLLVGNHDLPNAAKRAHAVEIFGTLNIPHITVADRPDYLRIPTRNGEVQIVALPWVTRSHILARDEYRGLSSQEIDQLIEQVLFSTMQTLLDKVTDDAPAVMVAHGTVPGAVFGMERSVLLGNDLLLEPSILKDPRFAYVALGHIHKHQSLHEQPPVVYSGSIERIDFGEAREEKGFVVAEIGDGPTRWEFIKTPTRPMRQITLDVREAPDPMQQIHDGLSRMDVSDAVVKLIIRATPDNVAHVNNRDIRALLKEAAHIASIVRDVERPQRLRLGNAQEIAESGPRALLDAYFESRLIPRERRELLLSHADRIFAEAEETD